MPMMAKMRGLAPWFIIGVGGLFVLFMMISDSNVLEALGGSTNNIGSVNGVEITYQEFQNALDQQIENKKNQTGKDVEDEELEQLRNQVWEALVTQKLINQEIEKYGLYVSDQEIKDIILGDNPPDFLKQNFIDSTGRFNRQMYETALFDPRNKEPLLQAEQIVRQNQLSEKLQSLLFASVTVGEAEVLKKYMDDNIKLNVDYAPFEIILWPDSTFKVTDEEVKKYYDENLDKYKIQAQRKVKFVLFPNQASKEDSNIVKESLESVAYSFKNDTASFKSFVDIYSSAPYSKDTISIKEISRDHAKEFFSAVPNSILGPYIAAEGYALYHFISSFASNETFVEAEHILIGQLSSDAENLAEATKVYQQLMGGANFNQVAKEKSIDKMSGQNGGYLGWFGKGETVPEFEKACFEGKIGEIQKPVKTSFGYHIIRVLSRNNTKFVVERIVNPVKQSATTKDAIFNQANDFSYIAQKNGFESEAKLLKLELKETPPFQKTATAVPLIGGDKRLVDFAFENGLNTVSDVYKVVNGYVVMMVSEITNEGFRPFDEVKAMVKNLVVRDKKFEKSKKLAESVLKKVNGDINKITSVDSRIKVANSGEFTINTTVPNIGRDYAFYNYALSLEPNKLSGPFRCARGYYLMRLVSKTNFDKNAYELQSSNLRNSILQERRNALFTAWLGKLKEEGDIVDNRQKFFKQ